MLTAFWAKRIAPRVRRGKAQAVPVMRASGV